MPSHNQESVPKNGVEKLVAQFIARTLPKAQWTHQAHLCAGLWHVVHHGADDAMSLLRTRIRAYNESVDTQNTETSGYHETITRFYVIVIEKFLLEADRTLPFEDLATQLITRYGHRELPLRYYSRNRLFSVTARLNWVEPDLQSIHQ
jgi:hypothetical protein